MVDTKKTTKATLKASKKTTEVKTLAELHEDLKNLRNDHQESRRSHRMGELVNPHVLTVQRKNIARALTALKQAEKSAVKEEN